MAIQRKEKIWGGAAGAAEGGTIGPGAASVTLGLFLLPGGRPGRCLAGASKEVPAVAGVVFLFLLPRGRPRPRGATGGQGSGENLQHQPWKQGRNLEKP
jgi:hypothetical protein